MLVFVYGTLTDPDRADALLADREYVGDAVLEGLHRVEGAYPTLAPAGSVEGRLLRTTDVETLDAYEGVESGLYVRVPLPVRGSGHRAEEESRVAVYVGDPDRLDADATWPGDGAFRRRVRDYLRENDVCVRGPSDRQD